MATTADILQEVAAERYRQDALFGEQNHAPAFYYTILGEEFGEVGQAINEREMDNYREELIRVAAVAVAMAECYDRNTA